MDPSTINSDQNQPAGLVGSHRCREIIFPDEPSRISERFFYKLQAERLIPFYKIGGRTFYDVVQVRAALDKHFQRKVR
jgi:hypothetical protein